MVFFFPEVHQLIDWTKIPESLEKELKRITASAKTKKRFADKLYKVWLLRGEEIWILIHIEIQSQYEENFPQRMYIYNYRAFDLYQKPVISLAILGDERVNWRQDSYNYTIAGCEVSLKFPTVKLLDYEESWSELETSSNPFAIIVMAHLKTKATTGKLPQREQWKWKLIRGLYEKEFEREQIIKLFEKHIAKAAKEAAEQPISFKADWFSTSEQILKELIQKRNNALKRFMKTGSTISLESLRKSR